MHRLHIWSYALTAAILIATPAVAEEFTDKIQKQFPVKPGETLVLKAEYGGIEIKTANVQSVQVEVVRRVEADSKAQAQQIFDDFALGANSAGGVLELTGHFKTGW